jgi:hypothetical protein
MVSRHGVYAFTALLYCRQQGTRLVTLVQRITYPGPWLQVWGDRTRDLCGAHAGKGGLAAAVKAMCC